MLFAMNLDSRSTCNSQCHLSTDYEWETLPSIDENALFTAALESPPTAFARKVRKDKRSTPSESGAIPKSWTTKDIPSTEGAAAFPQPSKGQAAIETPPPLSGLKPAASPTPSLATLQLQKETQELEIKKLELQLQLAQLQGTQTAAPNSIELPPGKSLGDLKAPQKTLHLQPWPHIFAPGEPKMYTELSMLEFCAGYLVIVQQSATKPHFAALLEHFHQVMVLASNYQWSAVRSFHYKVLHSLELGLIKWGDSFNHLKLQFLTPSSLLSEVVLRKMAKASIGGDAIPPSLPKPTILRNQICDEWSWYNNYSSADCPKQHICVVCKCSDHQAFACPKPKFPAPARRTDPTPQA